MRFFKFGVSYNLFDGEELLEDSIMSIRDYVDFISVVYQTESYWGNNCSDDLEDYLIELKEDKLIDEIVKYDNNKRLSPHHNQINKRNIGLNISRKNYCTHHMSMDCDEFYVEEQFKNLIDWYKKNPYKVGYADFTDYYKSPSLVIDKPHDTYVSLFFPIKNNNVSYVLNYRSPVLVDPTRRPNYDDYYVFDPSFIEMHHMTMVRKNIKSKIINAAKRLNYNSQDKINKLIEYYNNWTEDQLVGLNEEGFLKLKKIEPKIELDMYYEYE